ncbi:hypothetical protein VTO73DRAFT_487 [Trametes versicolor]
MEVSLTASCHAILWRSARATSSAAASQVRVRPPWLKISMRLLTDLGLALVFLPLDRATPSCESMCAQCMALTTSPASPSTASTLTVCCRVSVASLPAVWCTTSVTNPPSDPARCQYRHFASIPLPPKLPRRRYHPRLTLQESSVWCCPQTPYRAAGLSKVRWGGKGRGAGSMSSCSINSAGYEAGHQM